MEEKKRQRVWYEAKTLDGSGAAWVYDRGTSATDIYDYSYLPFYKQRGLPPYEPGDTITFIGCSPNREQLKKLISNECFVFVYENKEEAQWLKKLCNNQLHVYIGPHASATHLAWHLNFPKEKSEFIVEVIDKLTDENAFLSGHLRAIGYGLSCVDWRFWEDTPRYKDAMLQIGTRILSYIKNQIDEAFDRAEISEDETTVTINITPSLGMEFALSVFDLYPTIERIDTYIDDLISNEIIWTSFHRRAENKKPNIETRSTPLQKTSRRLEKSKK